MRQPRNIQAEECMENTLSRCFLCLLSLHEHQVALQCFPSGDIMVYARDFYLPRVSSVPVFKQDKVGIFGRLLMLLIVSSACSFMNAFSAGVFSSVFVRKNPPSSPAAMCCHPPFHWFAGTFCVVMQSLSQGKTQKGWYIILEKMVRARRRGWGQQSLGSVQYLMVRHQLHGWNSPH